MWPTGAVYVQSVSVPRKKEIWLVTAKKAKADPWVTVYADSIGPFTIWNNNKTHTLRPLIAGWFEIVQATNNLATLIQDLFLKFWLACYPRPQSIALDNGVKFKREFKLMCENYGIKAQPTSSQYPQASAISKRVHKVVIDMLRFLIWKLRIGR
jgi:hypothetical protein